jgi:hypothetical protein
MVDVLGGFSPEGNVAEHAIEMLAGVPPHHDLWDDIDSFIGRVRALAADKLRARELKKHEEELRRALGHLHEAGPDILRFHEALDVLGWAPVDFDAGDWPAAATLCFDVYELLARHSSLHQSEPANRTAAKERRRQLDALEEEVDGRVQRLRGLLLNPSPRSPLPTGSAEVQDASPVTEGPENDPLHAPVDADGVHYSVFTLGEERSLMTPRPGVCLVFASPATGLDSMDASMTGMASRRGPLVEIPESVQPADLAPWVRSNVPGSTVVWQRLGRWFPELEAGLQHLTHAQRQGGFRIVLVGGPAEGRSFIAMTERDNVMSLLDGVIACGRWDVEALDARIHNAHLDTGGRSATDVLSATRGWHRLLEVMWTRKGMKSGLDSMISAFNATFRSPGGLSGFRAALGLTAFPEAEAVFRLMARRTYSPLPKESVTKWLEKDTLLGEEIILQAIEFLMMFQLLELSPDGRLLLDPLAREVVISEPA